MPDQNFSAKLPKANFHLVEIKWRVEKDPLNCNDTYVLYQAYGDSPIYGRNSLLYIGKTIRQMKQRTNEHEKTDFERINGISYRVGIFAFADKDLVSLAESLLITMCKPSYNSSSIKDISELAKNEKYLILNKGDRGDLPLEISNIWW